MFALAESLHRFKGQNILVKKKTSNNTQGNTDSFARAVEEADWLCLVTVFVFQGLFVCSFVCVLQLLNGMKIMSNPEMSGILKQLLNLI